MNELAQQGRSKILANTYSEWIKNGDRVLDVGCGDGIVTEKLQSKLKLKLSGCDIRNYLLRDFPFALMTQENKIPYADKSFDTVLFNDVLHHTSRNNQMLLIKEAVRIARKTIIILEALPSMASFVGDIILNKLTHPTMVVPLTMRTADDWIKHLEKFPVTIQTMHPNKKYPTLFPHILFALRLVERKK